MRRFTLLALSAIALWMQPLRAQVVVQPEAKLTPSQSAVRDALYRLRDSLQLVEAASARIARDLRYASNQALSSRARVMGGRCGIAVVQLDSTVAVVREHSLPANDSLKVRAKLEATLRTVRGDLERCNREFLELAKPENAEELRGYGIGRGKRVQEAIRPVQQAMQMYFQRALGTDYRPATAGAGSIPSGRL